MSVSSLTIMTRSSVLSPQSMTNIQIMVITGKTKFKSLKKKNVILILFHVMGLVLQRRNGTEKNNCTVPMGFLLSKIWVAFSVGKPAATELCYPTYWACWVSQCFHKSLNSDMDHGIYHMRTDANACECTQRCTDTRKRVCTESWLWEKKSLAAQRNQTCISCMTDWCFNQLSYINSKLPTETKGGP